MSTWMDKLGNTGEQIYLGKRWRQEGFDQAVHFEHVTFDISLRQASKYVRQPLGCMGLDVLIKW